MHLHDHSGKAYFNYRMLEKIGFERIKAVESKKSALDMGINFLTISFYEMDLENFYIQQEPLANYELPPFHHPEKHKHWPANA